MKHLLVFLVAACFAATLTACDGDTIGSHHLSLKNGVLTAHVHGQPDATISAEGDLKIDGKPVAVTPAQHDLLKKYYGDVVAIRTAGIETGKAGAAMAGHAIGAVAQGLAHGNPDSIGPKIDAQAKKIEDKALAVCDDVAVLQSTQDAIAASLPAFKPYATFDGTKTSDCKSETDIRS